MYIDIANLQKLRKAGNRPFEYTAICPACGHEGVFYIYLRPPFWYCCHRASCNIRGCIKNPSEESITPSQSLLDLKESLQKLYTMPEEIHEVDLDLFSDPLNDKTAKDYVFAYNYMKNRKFTEEDLRKYQIRVGKSFYNKEKEKTDNTWKGRIIFPFYESGRPVYAIGRSYNDMLPKYLNTDGEKSVIVYNLDQIKNRTCIICEGLISSIFAEKYSGISAVCLLGKSISNSQFWQIRSCCDKIFCSLDGGVDQSDLCKRFFKAGAEVYVVDLPGTLDPDETGPSYKYYVENARRYTLL